MKTQTTRTAYQSWDARWQTEDGRKDWIQPQDDVVNLVPFLTENGVQRVLDLGSGVGRHAIFLADQGFDVFALDGSRSGIQQTEEKALEMGLTVSTQLGFMNHLPYEDAFFDFVLSWNVIYHGNLHETRQAISEIGRVLKLNGFFQGTFLTKRNLYYGKGTRIAEDTYIHNEVDEKEHPHCYHNALDACAALHGFEILSLSQHEHRKPNSWHWHYVCQKV